MTKRPFLTLVQDRPEARARKITAWRCAVCEREQRASGPLMAVYLEADVTGGEVVPLSPAMACMSCFSAGKVTIV